MRLAQIDDIESISELIQLSARKLAGQFYDSTTIEQALKGAFGVDTQLIKDKTYFVMTSKSKIIACGGWSFRKTLFGSDNNNLRDSEKLDPQIEAAKIRAFFIHPSNSRMGLGEHLLKSCEQAAITYGFSKIQLMSTLSGIDFYRKHGYSGKSYIFHDMGNGHKIKFLPMEKSLL